MDWLDSYNRIDEGATVESRRINHLLFSDDLLLLASSEQDLQHALCRFPLRATRRYLILAQERPRYYVFPET